MRVSRIPSRFRPFALAVLAAFALVATACAPGPDPEPTKAPVTIPATPVGGQAEWVLSEINAEGLSEASEFRSRFDQIMFEEMSIDDLRKIFEDLRAAAPWTPTAYEGSQSQARVTIEATQATYDMTVSVADDGRMNGLFFGQPQPPRTPATSWQELEAAIDGAPYEVSLQVTEPGAAEPRRLIGASTLAPIGSIFKLWVLDAVVAAIEAGALSWEDVVTIDAEVRSLPSGELQNLPDGATVTVREAAQKMIAISDNTATDALIRAVGRDAVEESMVTTGHSSPLENTPLLTTRELFWLLFGDASLRERWDAADSRGREMLLAEIPAGVPSIEAIGEARPGWKGGADWFASHDDLALAHVALQEKAESVAGAPVRDILAENPGLAFGEEWDYVGFKGGSSIGVLAGSWYLEREGEEPLVLTVLARADDAETLTTNASVVFGFVEDAAALLAME